MGEEISRLPDPCILPAEERVSKCHNHEKKTSCQTFAEASKRKFVPKSNGSTLKE